MLAPIPSDRRWARTALLAGGLSLYGVSDGLLVQAGLGLDPWDVLHQGLARTLGLQVGTWAVLIGAVVLLGWIPLRQRPGLGTLANVVVVGTVIDLTVSVVGTPHALPGRVAMLATGVVLNGVATGAYIGAGLGPGPRDGLSVGIAARGVPLRRVRTLLELTVLAVGWCLGGTVGAGTLVYALAIGPITHVTVPALRLASRGRPPGQTSASRSASLTAPSPVNTQRR